VTTKIGRRSVAVVLGILALAGVSANASAKSSIPGFGGLPRVRDVFRIKRPKLRFKQNDLAAANLVKKVEAATSQSPEKTLLVGTCRNLGSKLYQGNERIIRIEKKVGEAWVPQGEKAIPALLPGQSFTVSLPLVADDAGEYRLVVTPGAAADSDPENDMFLLAAPAPEPQAAPAPLDPPTPPVE
jgi:hypothetical protein